MNDLSNDVLAEIFSRVKGRKHISLVCRKWYELDRVLTRELQVGQGLLPPEPALAALSSRFFNLTTIEISYLGWMSSMGKQVDDACLYSLSVGCVNLTDVSLNYCSFITDVGIANIALCRRLTAVRLNFIPCVSERGLLSLVSGCHSLRLLHINRLVKVRVVEWLEFIGTNRQIESLAIRSCRGVGESELVKLGRRGWRNLREVFFEVDVVHRPSGDFFGHNGRVANQQRGWKFADPEGVECCPNLEVLSLTNCLSMSGTGLLWLLTQCKSLRAVRIDACVGVQDDDICSLVKNNPQIVSLSLRIACHVPTASLTNLSFMGIADNCHFLEAMMLTFTEGDFIPSFMESGIMTVLQSCTRLKKLSFQRIPFLRERTMITIFHSSSLESVEFIECFDLTDEMMQLANSNLTELTLINCPLLTDAWLNTLKTSDSTLAYLTIGGCPRISREAASAATRVLDFNRVV